MKFSSEHFARALRVKRAERGISQKQLADAVGVTLTTISYYETQRNAPTFANVVSIADYFGCSLDEFASVG